MFENSTELKFISVVRCIPNCFLGKAGILCTAKANNRNMFLQYPNLQKFANAGRCKHLLSDFFARYDKVTKERSNRINIKDASKPYNHKRILNNNSPG